MGVNRIRIDPINKQLVYTNGELTHFILVSKLIGKHKRTVYNANSQILAFT